MMSNLRKRYGRRLPQVSQRALKNTAAVLMLLVNGSRIIIEKGLLRLDTYTVGGLLDAMDADSRTMQLVGVASIIQVLQGLLPPVFALLLVEGFLHTDHYAKYLGRVAAAALVSELAYDFAMHGKFLEFSEQNPMLALVVALVMLRIMKALDRVSSVERAVVQILLLLCAGFWVVVFRVESGVELILLAAIFYCFREHDIVKLVLGVLVSLTDTIGPLAFCGLMFYNGERRLKLPSYVYYAIYPLHLLVFGIVARCFLLQ